MFCLGEQQKSYFLSGRAAKRGGGLNGCATMKKKTFFNVRKKVPLATKPKGEGGLKALVAGPLRKEPFFAASFSGCKKNKVYHPPLTKIKVSITL